MFSLLCPLTYNWKNIYINLKLSPTHWKNIFIKLYFCSCVPPLTCRWKNIFKKVKILSCVPPLIYKMKIIFCFASCGFSEKYYLVVVWCWAWDAGMVRPPRLVSYACLYTTLAWLFSRVFSVSSPQPYWQNYYFPLADMLSWAVWFKFLLNKVIANTCLFILTSFSKQSASWNVLEICELCALSTDLRKTYSVNKYMYTGSSSYSFDWGG